jgi:hypothetical protein
VRFTQKQYDREVSEFGMNGLMVQYVRSALSQAYSSSEFAQVECPVIALGGVKRLMTELDSAPKVWPDFKQPLPSEFLVNLLNALEFEREYNFERNYRLQPSDAFRLRITTNVKCPICYHLEYLPVQSNYVLELYTNGCNDVA